LGCDRDVLFPELIESLPQTHRIYFYGFIDAFRLFATALVPPAVPIFGIDVKIQANFNPLLVVGNA
jgi:hypothetical protein